VHDTAVVEDDVMIGDGTKVWHHAHLRSGSRIGSDCMIGKNVYVDTGVEIGDRVKIQNNVSVYTGVTLDDDVFVGPSAVFTNDRYPRATNPRWEVVPTRVRRGASIGANATLRCGIEVGSFAAVGAGAVVTPAVADPALAVANPARRAGWVCECGAVVSREDRRPDDLRCTECRGA
jgi:UDP-2-acetamido-3-amino-2,3-dideoxy-glucuronate N-acetyltransferase